MPAADQPAATATHVIPIGMDMPVSLPLMPLYTKVMGDSRRHKGAADYQHAHHLAVLAVWSIMMQ